MAVLGSPPAGRVCRGSPGDRRGVERTGSRSASPRDVWCGTDARCAASHGRSVRWVARNSPGGAAMAGNGVPPAMPTYPEPAIALRRGPISERSSELQQQFEAEAATEHPVAKPRDRAKEAGAARAPRRIVLQRVVCAGTLPGACRCCAFQFSEFVYRGPTDHESRPCIDRRARHRVRCRCVATSACRCPTSARETAARGTQRDKHVSCVGASLQSREGSRCRECSRANA